MVEFTETTMRKMCRYPRCGCKLPEPVSNPRGGVLLPGVSYQFLSVPLPGLRGQDGAQD